MKTILGLAFYTLLSVCHASTAFPSVGRRYQAGDVILAKESVPIPDLFRRDVCDAGFSTCSGTGLCCPSTGTCCETGCGPTSASCCTNGKFCPSGFACCGDNACVPDGGQCCGGGSACDKGNICVKVGSNPFDLCCTDSTCSAYVSLGTTMTFSAFPTAPNGVSTMQASLAAAAPPVTTAIANDPLSAYTYTITWFYTSYFYTTAPPSHAAVTFTPVTTSSTVVVTASNSGAALATLSAISSTLPTPAAATSLASLASTAGSTTSTQAPALLSGSTFHGVGSSWALLYAGIVLGIILSSQ